MSRTIFPEFFHMQEKREQRQHGGANPFIDPTAFAAYLGRSEADFRKQLEAQAAKAEAE